MAQVKLEEILDHLDSEVKAAFAIALHEVAPNADIDHRVFFKAFVRAVRRKTSTWETVPDHYVES
jgi:hypothetical protein